MSEENKLLSDENQRLHNANIDIAQANVNLLGLLEKEKSKMPVRFGRPFFAFLTGAGLLAGGLYRPLATIEIVGSKFESTNLLQVCGLALLIVTFLGPFVISAIKAYRSK
jgi:hypothetical protein